MIRCQLEDLAIREEMTPILQAGFEEFDTLKELGLEVDWELYGLLESRKRLRIYTAREQARLVGYAVFVLGPSLRRRGILQAQQDVIHVVSGKRPWATVALLRHSEQALRDEGVKVLYHSSPTEEALGRLLQRLGHKRVASTYCKLL